MGKGWSDVIERIRKAFLKNEWFWVEYGNKSYCREGKRCGFFMRDQCFWETDEWFQVDLKKYYDACEVCTYVRWECLKLYSKSHPGRKPVYIVFGDLCSHHLKMLKAGDKVIVIFVDREEDIELMERNGIFESRYSDSGSGSGGKIQFFGFGNEDFKGRRMGFHVGFIRFILYKSGKTRCFYDNSDDCCRVEKSGPPYAIYEVCVMTDEYYEAYEYLKYVGYQKFRIANCIVCRNFVEERRGAYKMCRVNSELGVPASVKDGLDTSRARSCRLFAVNQEEMERRLKKGLEDEMMVLVDESIVK